MQLVHRFESVRLATHITPLFLPEDMFTLTPCFRKHDTKKLRFAFFSEQPMQFVRGFESVRLISHMKSYPKTVHAYIMFL